MIPITSLVVPTLFVAGALAQWPNPEPMKGQFITNAHDPSLIRRPSDNKLFLFGTGGNITVHTSSSLYGPWTALPGALPHNAGAPQTYLVNGTYYLYYSTEDRGPTNDPHTANISVASSPSMDPGTWTDHGRLPFKWSPDYNVLDASLLTIPPANGKPTRYLMSFGSYWQDIYQMELSDPLHLKPGAKPVHLALNKTHMDHNVTRVWNDPSEGSFQFAHKVNDTTQYFLFFSSGACCNAPDDLTTPGNAYKVMVCRSPNPSGEFFDRSGKSCLTENGGTEILGTHDDIWAPGGQGVMHDEEINSTILYYHYVPYNQTTGKAGTGSRFGWNKLIWDAEGWPKVVALS